MRIKTLRVSEVPNYASGWSPKESIEMMDRILSEVKRRVRKDGPGYVFVITIKSRTDIGYDEMTAADHERFPVIHKEFAKK